MFKKVIQFLAFGGCAACLVTGVLAAEDAEALKQMKIKLMQSTSINAVMGLKGPASEFISDESPDTMQIVFLEKKSDGPSRVSEDGEVIFLNDASDKEQQKLIQKAFEIKARLRLSANP